MDVHDMTTIADMLRTIVKTEMDGHFVRPDESQPRTPLAEDVLRETDEDQFSELFGSRNPYPPENVWLYAAIRRGDIETPGGPESNHYKLWFMLRHADRYGVHYYGDWLNGTLAATIDLLEREAERAPVDERRKIRDEIERMNDMLKFFAGEFETYKTYVNRYRRELRRKRGL